MQSKYLFSMQKVEICDIIPKDTLVHYAHSIGAEVVFTSPTELQPKECIWIDVRNRNVEIVEREGIVIWRAGWLN